MAAGQPPKRPTPQPATPPAKGHPPIIKKIEHKMEIAIFESRWLLAPFYFGLVLCMVLLLIAFMRDLFNFFPNALGAKTGDVIIIVLSLVDIVMVSNLILLVIFAGYENFVSKINTSDHEDRPEWMGTVTFSDLKIKLMGTIVAISGIDLLKSFLNVKAYTDTEIAWRVGLHLTFVTSGLLFALMDRMSHRNNH